MPGERRGVALPEAVLLPGRFAVTSGLIIFFCCNGVVLIDVAEYAVSLQRRAGEVVSMTPPAMVKLPVPLVDIDDAVSLPSLVVSVVIESEEEE